MFFILILLGLYLSAYLIIYIINMLNYMQKSFEESVLKIYNAEDETNEN